MLVRHSYSILLMIVMSPAVWAADVDLFAQNASDAWEEVRGALRDYDVVMFDYRGSGCASHSGLMNGGRVLQAGRRVGVTNTPFSRFKKSFLRAYRHKCLA